MKSKTRFYNFLKKMYQVKKKIFKINFSNAIFFLFLGFLFGNLFCTFLTNIRFFFWDGFIILNFIFFLEIINYIVYHKKGRFFFFFWTISLHFRETFFWKNFNYFKIGFLLGFFIDAFKVGS